MITTNERPQTVQRLKKDKTFCGIWYQKRGMNCLGRSNALHCLNDDDALVADNNNFVKENPINPFTSRSTLVMSSMEFFYCKMLEKIDESN